MQRPLTSPPTTSVQPALVTYSQGTTELAIGSLLNAPPSSSDRPQTREATGVAPTKLNVPNRKKRHLNNVQDPDGDLNLAMEISTSLMAQIRALQGVIADRDSTIEELQSGTSRFEDETKLYPDMASRNPPSPFQEPRGKQEEPAGLKTSHSAQRIQMTIDRSTRPRERDTSSSNISIIESDRTSIQSNISGLDDQDQIYSRVNERRRRTSSPTPVNSQSREFTDSKSQIEEGSLDSTDATKDKEDISIGLFKEMDLLQTSSDDTTAEQSPSMWPSRSTSPHSRLEAEVLKSSLHHAQRTIQAQRGLLHREKIENIKLNQIIKTLRDDLEGVRTNAERLESQTKELDVLRAECNTAQDAVKELSLILDHAKSGREELETECEQLREKNREASDCKRRLEKDLELSSKAAEEYLEEQHAANQERIQELEQERAQLEIENEALYRRNKDLETAHQVALLEHRELAQKIFVLAETAMKSMEGR